MNPDETSPMLLEKRDKTSSSNCSSLSCQGFFQFFHSADREISRQIFDSISDPYRPMGYNFCYLLEFSAHGVPWIAFVIIFLLFPFMNIPSWRICLAANLLLGLITDLLIVVVLKLNFKRARPSYNPGEQLGSVQAVDQFSFPSGHATRSFFIASFVTFIRTFKDSDLLASVNHDIAIAPSSDLISLSVVVIAWIWALCIGWSRVALGRHYLSDVIAGSLIGIFNALVVVLCIWISSDTSFHARKIWLHMWSMVFPGVK